MASPNIVNITSITARTAANALFTNTSNIITNSASSNTVVKVNYASITNYGASTLTCNVGVNRNGTTFLLAGSISVPTVSTLIVLAKDTCLYLEEGDTLVANTSSNSAAHITSSYEIIL